MTTSAAVSDSQALAWRERTPAADAFMHFNHASCSLPDRAVFDVQRDCLVLEAELGMHRALERWQPSLQALPGKIAAMLGVQAAQICLAESASRSWALALSAVAPQRRLQLFVSAHEWAGNLASAYTQPRISVVKLRAAPGDHWAAVVHDALEQRDRTAVPVVSLPIVACASGTVHRLEGVAQAVQAAHGWFFVDASQAVGQMPVDAHALGCDVLVFPARKWLRGPRGIAVLCVSPRALDQFESPALLDTYGSVVARAPAGASPADAVALHARADAGRFQLYEYHPALRLGLLAAVEVAQRIGTACIAQRLAELQVYMRTRFDALGLAGTGRTLALLDQANAGALCATVTGTDAAALAARLWQRGINVAAIDERYAPLAFGGPTQARGVLRLSPHVISTYAEIDALFDALEQELAAA
jgi:cysteine desulfurase/selenocysteine lyase